MHAALLVVRAAAAAITVRLVALIAVDVYNISPTCAKPVYVRYTAAGGLSIDMYTTRTH